MSILIKGINPPKSCYTCSWYNKVQCPVNDGKCYYRTTRHPSCPLIELPPHGRLIDADKLANETFYGATSAPYITYRKFVNAPTVIEAEGSES